MFLSQAQAGLPLVLVVYLSLVWQAADRDVYSVQKPGQCRGGVAKSLPERVLILYSLIKSYLAKSNSSAVHIQLLLQRALAFHEEGRSVQV